MNNKTTDKSSLEYYLNLQYPITLYPDSEEGYVAEIKDLPGCITQGETAEETLSMIEDARKLWLQTAHKHGDAIPLPSTDNQFSGKTMLRMPRSLHQALAEGAQREEVSLNQYLVSLLSHSITRKSFNYEMTDTLTTARKLKEFMTELAEFLQKNGLEFKGSKLVESDSKPFVR
jgi:antitoxin HicB